MIGSYVGEAIEATIGNAFRKKGSEPASYPEKPRIVAERIARENDKRKAEAQKENEKVFALAWMSSFVQVGKNWGKNKKAEG